MTISWSSNTYNEFTIEAQRIEELTWAALGVQPHTEVLVCGYEKSKPIIDRALAIGAKITVIETNTEALRAAAARGLETIRASTTGIPVRNDRFALAIAFHYLHEIDPTYHTQVIAELGRISRRLAIVEPGPPSDLLGSRIASLYSRAKRRLGQFEQYQNLEYWRRLLLGVRSHVSPVEIRYAHLPPRPFLQDTMRVVLDSMRIAGAPDDDMRALHGLADASDAQLVPQPRFVLLAGISSADIPDRPRFNELQKLAPVRYADRKKVKPEPSATTADGVTYAPTTIAKNRRRLGVPWFGNQNAPQPAFPSPSDHPIAIPFHPPAAHAQLAAPLAPVPFGAAAAPAATATNHFGPPGGFGLPQSAPDSTVANDIANMFSVPPIPGTDSMEWSDDPSSVNLKY